MGEKRGEISKNARESQHQKKESVLKDDPPSSLIAAEFFDYYYQNLPQIRVQKYFGGAKAREKVEALITEFQELVIDRQFKKIDSPIRDRQDGGKVFYIGDTHGSIADTERIIQFLSKEIKNAKESREKEKPEKYLKIIFLGDYVDRNDMDIHNLLYILSFAVIHRDFVRLLRGNHEEFTMNRNYGFYRNMKRNFKNTQLFEKFQNIFTRLPLVHYLEFKGKRIMGVHAGVPFSTQTIDTMPTIPNFTSGKDRWDSQLTRVTEMEPFPQQMLWNDPTDHLPPKKFYLPSRRGIGFIFGEAVFDAWVSKNHVDRVIRGHEVFLEGHKEFFDNRLFSLFSSSYYVSRVIEAKILEVDLVKPWESNWKHFTIRKDL